MKGMSGLSRMVIMHGIGRLWLRNISVYYGIIALRRLGRTTKMSLIIFNKLTKIRVVYLTNISVECADHNDLLSIIK